MHRSQHIGISDLTDQLALTVMANVCRLQRYRDMALNGD